MRVVMAFWPRSYRQAMGRAVADLRPHVTVAVVDPEDLRDAVVRLEPGLVLADRPDNLPDPGGPSWVEYRPYERPQAKISLGGRRWELGAVDLGDLLSLVDRAEEFWRAGTDPGGR